MGIGNNIREFRLKNGLTQKQLGERCGMADSAIRRYELEKANPKIETLQKIADALNVSIADLDTRSDFAITHLQQELQALRKKETQELNQIPDNEWFGDKWNEISQKYRMQRSIIEKKINDLSKPCKEFEDTAFLLDSGERIRNIREKKEMSQETLASLTNIPLSLIRKYENCQRTPCYEHIFQIAKVFGVPTFDISPLLESHTSSNLEEDIMYNTLIQLYNLLNKEGQKKVLEQIKLIAKIPDYMENEE